MAKMAEDMDHRDFRERARDDYNNRRAEGRLGVYPSRFTPSHFKFCIRWGNLVFLCYFSLAPAQLTCATLDEQMEKSVSFFLFTVR